MSLGRGISKLRSAASFAQRSIRDYGAAYASRIMTRNVLHVLRALDLHHILAHNLASTRTKLHTENEVSPSNLFLERVSRISDASFPSTDGIGPVSVSAGRAGHLKVCIHMVIRRAKAKRPTACGVPRVAVGGCVQESLRRFNNTRHHWTLYKLSNKSLVVVHFMRSIA